jgi:hypothetical protein
VRESTNPGIADGPEGGIEEWYAYLGGLSGLEPRLQYTEKTFGSVLLDLTRMHEYLGKTRVHWRDGIQRIVEARHLELLRS